MFLFVEAFLLSVITSKRIMNSGIEYYTKMAKSIDVKRRAFDM
jgi:hypothetical protein